MPYRNVRLKVLEAHSLYWLVIRTDGKVGFISYHPDLHAACGNVCNLVLARILASLVVLRPLPATHHSQGQDQDVTSRLPSTHGSSWGTTMSSLFLPPPLSLPPSLLFPPALLPPLSYSHPPPSFPPFLPSSHPPSLPPFSPLSPPSPNQMESPLFSSIMLSSLS